MKKLIICTLAFIPIIGNAQNDSTQMLQEVYVTSLIRNEINTGNLVERKEILNTSIGQEPSHILSRTPGIFSYGDNGTEFGYGYFRLRGMDQSRINVTLDGLPVFQEIEDHGTYFANTPDLLSSISSMKIERGSGVVGYGTASYAGSISLESIDPRNKDAYFDMGYGNFNTYRVLGSYTSGTINKFAVHVRGSASGTDGFREHSYNKSQSGVFKVGYYFNPNHSIDILSINGYHRNGQGYFGVSELPKKLNPFTQVPNGCAQEETDDFFLTINRLQYRGKLSGSCSLVGSIYWNHLDGNYRIKYGDLFNYGLLQNMYGGSVYNKLNIDNFSFISGVNYTEYSRRHIGTKLPGDTIIDSFHGNPGEIEYINTGKKREFDISERVRYNYERLSLQVNIQYRYTGLDYIVGKPACEGDRNNSHDWSFFNTGLIATYSPRNNQKLYFSWNNTGREPGRTDIFGGEYFTGEYAIENPNCKEEVQDLEVGYEYVSSLFSFNTNLYYMNFDNELVTTGKLSPQNGLPLHEPVSGYRTGLELYATVNPFKNFTVTTNIAWSKNKLKDLEKTHPYSPSFISFSEISYKWRFISASLNLHYRSSMYADLDNNFSLGDAFSLGGIIGFNITNNINLDIHLTNITNQLNTSNGSVDNGVLYYQIDSPFSMFINIRIKL